MSHTAIMWVTQRCNQACVFCLERDGTARIPDVAPAQVWDDLCALRAAGAEHITFMGGETFLRKDLPEILREAKSLGFTRVGVTTNGSVIGTPGFVAKMLDAGLDLIEISIHADTPALAALISGRSFTWSRQERALAELEELRARLSHLVVNVVVCRENADRMDAIVAGLIARHPRLDPIVKFKFVSFAGAAAADLPQLLHGDVDLRPALARLQRHGWGAWIYNFPLCSVPGHEATSHDTQALVLDWRYHDYDHGGHGGYYDTAFQLEGNVWPRACQRCSLAPLCPGVEETYRRLAGDAELVPSVRDPRAIVREVLASAGQDPSNAGAVLETLTRRHRPSRHDVAYVPQQGEAAIIFRHEDLGELTFEVGPRRAGVRSLVEGERLRLAYRKPAAGEPGDDARGEALLGALRAALLTSDRSGDDVERAVERLSQVGVGGFRHVSSALAGAARPDVVRRGRCAR